MAHSLEISAVAARAAIANGDISVETLTSQFLSQIAADNGRIGAVRFVLADQAMAAAREMDVRIRAGDALPPLAGLPFIIKENCDTAGAPCSAGLSFRDDYIPQVDCAITARLRAEGAIILGVAVSDPGAFSTRTPQVTHPQDPALTVGGSSGGSAAALATGFCLGAIGTDTGGSIRIPSACCGTVGLKPTFGSLPMRGIFPLVQSLDHVGPMARSVGDVELFWQALAGEGRKGEGRTGEGRNHALLPKTIGYDPLWVDLADQSIRTAFALGLERLKANGISVVEICLPDLTEISAMHGQIFLVEAAAYHSSMYGKDIESYPAIAREWFAVARKMAVGAYVDACTQRAAMTRAVDRILLQVDAIMTPTLCVARPLKFADTLAIAGVHHDFTMAMVRLTSLFNHTGHPAIAFALGGGVDPSSSSLQLVGAHRNEEVILHIAALLEQG